MPAKYSRLSWYINIKMLRRILLKYFVAPFPFSAPWRPWNCLPIELKTMWSLLQKKSTLNYAHLSNICHIILHLRKIFYKFFIELIIWIVFVTIIKMGLLSLLLTVRDKNNISWLKCISWLLISCDPWYQTQFYCFWVLSLANITSWIFIRKML